MNKDPTVQQCRSPVSPVMDSTSSDDFDDGDICEEVSELSERKPHFLDYDYTSHDGKRENSHEPAKADKTLEDNDEISDHAFAIAGKVNKDENTEKKHFLDENPIPPPEYTMKQDMMERKHRSLDRNFSRVKDSPKRKISLELSNLSLNGSMDYEMPHTEVFRGTLSTLDRSDSSGKKPTANILGADLGPKVECVYSLLNMLGQHDTAEMASKFFELSKNRETCIALRRSGCISILVQLLHSESTEEKVRMEAGAALHNVVHCHIDDKSGRREVRVLKLIEQLIEYCEFLRKMLANGETTLHDSERHPIVSIGTLMKTSFDEDHRHAMCSLGALQTISTLVQLDHEAHGAKSNDPNCITLRRYAGMTLTNLTFGDGNNKALLCSNKSFMKSLVMQIESSSDELVQVTASVLRNLSWRADGNMKQILNEIGAVKILTKAAMTCTQENTLKSILSALWNLSNHCSNNKAEFCECEGAIDFLVDMLNYDAPSKTMAVIENAGGILRNISSYIAAKEEYRQILRRRNCLAILLQQLKSSSLTVVSNASGTLGNLSANCVEDQKFLRDNTAIPMLRSLIYSKHKMISTGSTIALKNLLNYQKGGLAGQNMDSVSRSMDLKELPKLNVRKQRALEQELDKNLSNSYEQDEANSPKDEQSKNIGTQAEKLMSFYEKSERKSVDEDGLEFEDEPDKIDEGGAKGSNYQETDVDQPVNFSIRYAENVTEIEDDNSSSFERRRISIEDDCVRTYFTEGTPKVTSNSGSVTDLRAAVGNDRQTKPLKSIQAKSNESKPKKSFTPVVASGPLTPEKPFNYCEEGTPGDFSRCDSLSDLGELAEPKNEEKPKDTNDVSVKVKHEPTTPKSVKFSNNSNGTLLETPLMFSRHSSVESLESAGSVCVADDKSSVVSEFSRLASGIMSPYELPDSPTQSPPDQTNTFVVENTPAQFSCVTSLSNLSLDDEPKITKDCLVKEMQLMSHPSEEHEDVLEEIVDDNEDLLEQAISIGIRSSTRRPPCSSAAFNNNDTTREYCTEDTSVPLSKVGSNSNLSALSIETDNNLHRSDLSSESDDQLLQTAIQDGIMTRRATDLPLQVAGNSLDLLRRGAVPLYLSVPDETSRFGVEDSPKTFSVVSELSGITMGSEVIGIAKLNEVRENRSYSQHQIEPLVDSLNQEVFNDSLSSLSINSLDDEANILNDAIAVGSGTHSYHQTQTHYRNNPDDSCSSVDSFDEQQNRSLLEQTVQSGISKVTNTNSMSTKTGSSSEYFKRSKRELNNEQLLEEAINSGICKTTGQSQMAKTSSLVNNSKNVMSPTSVVLLKNTGVGKNVNAFENEVFQHHQQRQAQQKHLPSTNISNLEVSTNSVQSLMCRSNESAFRMSSYDFLKNSNCSASNMELSNEFMFEKGTLAENSCLDDIEKRKNPDLMVASVDRLTKELVATAEYLRLSDPNCVQKHKHRSSTNSLNDDSASFPTMSIDTPMFGSNSEVIKKVSHGKDTTTSNDMAKKTSVHNDETDTVKPIDTAKYGSSFQGIQFELGGEVNNQVRRTPIPFTSSGPMSIDSCSTMTNSTIICLEANKVASQLQNCAFNDSLSSLDLDNVRPPAEFDCVSLSTVTYDMPNTYSPLPTRSRKKSLPTGIMAKRAIGQFGERSSVENVNSLGLSNLDYINPPSIMDELMDSMTSVASITSEIADTQVASPYLLRKTYSNTIMNECSENDVTPIPSDISSNESTPRKGDYRKSPTIKQKRQTTDRFKTYTITGNIINDLKEQDDQILQVEINEQRRLTPRDKRNMDRERFETQILDTASLMNNDRLEDSDRTVTYTVGNQQYVPETNLNERLIHETASGSITYLSNVHSTDVQSKNASPTHLMYVQNCNKISNTNQSNVLTMQLFDNGSGLMSLEYEQNSETESCDQNRSINNDLYLDSAGDENGSSPEPKAIRGTKRNPYVSPYKRTSLNKSRHTPPKQFGTKQVDIKKIKNSPVTSKSPPVELKRKGLPSKTIVGSSLNKVPTPSKLLEPTRAVCKSKTFTEIKANPSKMPERQGTFIKEEESGLQLPVVSPTPALSKQSKPISKIPSKTGSVAKAFVSKMRNPLNKTGSTSEINVSKSRNSSINKSSTVPTRSNSNASIKAPLNSSRQTVVSSQTTIAASKRDITSKISSIWKRIDESRKQQTSNNLTTTTPPKLIRSSTFDASPAPGAVRLLPNITKVNTMKCPSSGNIKNIANNSGPERRGSLLNSSVRRYK